MYDSLTTCPGTHAGHVVLGTQCRGYLLMVPTISGSLQQARGRNGVRCDKDIFLVV